MNSHQFSQQSLPEWFAKADHPLTEEMRIEENDRRHRLKLLNKIMGLPFDEFYEFDAFEVANKSVSFKNFFDQHEKNQCVMRLIPNIPSLPKLRVVGKTVKNALKWFKVQKIDLVKYKVDFIDYSDKVDWSTIFVINKNGIFGVIIEGPHTQLTQGISTTAKPINFSFNFTSWNLNPPNKKAQEILTSIIQPVHIENPEVRKDLQNKMGAAFTRNYLEGYFETVTKEKHTAYLDYNRILGKMLQDFYVPTINVSADKSNAVRGVVAYPGKFIGAAKVILDDKLTTTKIKPNDVLVCKMLSQENIHLMKNCGAIVMDFGSLLSHVAIVARELKVPCIIGTQTATHLFRNGDKIEVDASIGIARLVSPRNLK